MNFSMPLFAASSLIGLAALAASPLHAAQAQGASTTGSKPAATHPSKSAKPSSVALPDAEAPSPGKKPPRSIRSQASPGFMDDGARKREGSPAR